MKQSFAYHKPTFYSLGFVINSQVVSMLNSEDFVSLFGDLFARKRNVEAAMRAMNLTDNIRAIMIAPTDKQWLITLGLTGNNRTRDNSTS